MSLTVSISIAGDKETLARIHKLGQSFMNFSDAMDRIGNRMSSFYQNEVFASQGGILGNKWDKLSPKYKLYKATGHTVVGKKRWRPNPKAKVYPGRGILVRTGKMQSGFRHKSTPDSVEVYNRMPYFEYHQLGEGVPQRQMIGVNGKVKNIIQEIINDDVKRKLARAGL